MLCPQGHPLPVPDFTAQFCPTCGSALINPCPVGHDNVANARYCRDCGRSMGLPSGTPTRSTLAVVPPTTAVLRTAPPVAADPWHSDRPTGAPPPVPPPDERDQPGRRRHGTGLLIAIGVIAVAVVGVVVALFVTSSPDATPGTGSVDTTPTTATECGPHHGAGHQPDLDHPLDAGAPPGTGPHRPAVPEFGKQEPGGDGHDGHRRRATAWPGPRRRWPRHRLPARRSSASSDSWTCPPSPSRRPCATRSTDAWQSSASSDGSYAQWAADEQAKTCVPNDSTDAGYQAALVADGHASAAKAQFTSLWNPIATSLGLQTWQPNQI